MVVAACGGLVDKSSSTLATPWTVSHQAPLFMEFSRQEYWKGQPFLLIAYGNGVRFMISKEDLTLGPGTRLDHSRTSV